MNFATLLGNQALFTAEIDNWMFYSNYYITYYPVKNLQLVGQLDFAAQTNSGMYPDTTKTATMFSGFIQAKYSFNRVFALSARYEFFNDYDGFLSGIYHYGNTTRGLLINGFTGGLEVKPISNLYFRAEYRYLAAPDDNNVFFSGNLDYLAAMYLTCGLKF
jgi:hypothetical protein